MKTLLSAVLLIAVSAWGQSKPATSSRPINEPCILVGSGAPSINDFPMCKFAKPHKPKPSVKTFTVHCHKEGCGKWDKGYELFSDPCDGWACTKPVETLPQHECGATPDECWRLRKGIDADTFYRALGGLETITNQQPDKAPAPAKGDCFEGNIDHEKQIPCPDKAAVPVEPRVEFSAAKQPETMISCTAGGPNYSCDLRGPLQVSIADGSSMVKLSDSEYSHLQQLRASVVEEERRLAEKYGANLGFDCSGDFSAMRAAGCFADHYEYKGQFLLIDKEGK